METARNDDRGDPLQNGSGTVFTMWAPSFKLGSKGLDDEGRKRCDAGCSGGMIYFGRPLKSRRIPQTNRKTLMLPNFGKKKNREEGSNKYNTQRRV